MQMAATPAPFEAFPHVDIKHMERAGEGWSRNTAGAEVKPAPPQLVGVLAAKAEEPLVVIVSD